jgi:transcriptional regulator with XRE-family HTH domain
MAEVNGAYLRETREMLGLTLLEVYVKAGVSPATLAGAEKKRAHPSAKLWGTLKPALHREVVKHIRRLQEREKELR